METTDSREESEDKHQVSSFLLDSQGSDTAKRVYNSYAVFAVPALATNVHRAPLIYKLRIKFIHRNAKPAFKWPESLFVENMF